MCVCRGRHTLSDISECDEMSQALRVNAEEEGNRGGVGERECVCVCVCVRV